MINIYKTIIYVNDIIVRQEYLSSLMKCKAYIEKFERECDVVLEHDEGEVNNHQSQVTSGIFYDIEKGIEYGFYEVYKINIK